VEPPQKIIGQIKASLRPFSIVMEATLGAYQVKTTATSAQCTGLNRAPAFSMPFSSLPAFGRYHSGGGSYFLVPFRSVMGTEDMCAVAIA
jgi:hypothetical protein